MAFHRSIPCRRHPEAANRVRRPRLRWSQRMRSALTLGFLRNLQAFMKDLSSVKCNNGLSNQRCLMMVDIPSGYVKIAIENGHLE